VANIRINSLPATTTVLADDVLPMDGATTRKIKPSDLLTSVRPFATQPEAAAGVNAVVAMSPLTTAQAISAQLPSTTAGQNMLSAADPAAQRGLLGLGGAAVLSIGTTASTVAAGDDSRITGAAQKSANLSDLASAATSRTNLGLGGSATLNVGSTAGTVAAGNDIRFAGVAGIAAQAVAEAGSDNATLMSPLRAAQAAAAYVLPTRTAIVAATLSAVIDAIRATGYYSEGDGGGGLYFRLSSSPSPAKRWHVQSADGAWWELSETLIDPRMLGAKFTGSTSDATVNTAAINAALDYHTLGGMVVIPPGRAYIEQDGANPWCLRQTKPNRIRTAGGLYSALIPIGGTGPGVNTLVYKPDPAISHNNALIQGVFLGDSYTSIRKGGVGIYLDTDVAQANLPQLLIKECFIGQDDVSPNFGILHLNNASNNINGGLYCALIENNIVVGGIRLNGSGDSNIIRKNILTGASTQGIWFDLVAGASELVIEQNNITCRGGAVVGDGGSRCKIIYNNIEQTGTGAADAAMINLRGLSGTMANCEIHGNHLGAFTGSGITANVRLRNQIAPKVTHNNMLAASGSTYGIDVTTTADPVLSPNTVGTGGAGAVLVGGSVTGLTGILSSLSLLNGFANVGSGYQNVAYIKEGSTATAVGAVTSGSSGAVIATLPVGARPSANILAAGYKGTGLGVFLILPNGDIVGVDVNPASTNTFSITFPVAGNGWSASDL
jgi:hypothetical protein